MVAAQMRAGDAYAHTAVQLTAMRKGRRDAAQDPSTRVLGEAGRSSELVGFSAVTPLWTTLAPLNSKLFATKSLMDFQERRIQLSTQDNREDRSWLA
jgi:hypothetical protein